MRCHRRDSFASSTGSRSGHPTGLRLGRPRVTTRDAGSAKSSATLEHPRVASAPLDPRGDVADPAQSVGAYAVAAVALEELASEIPAVPRDVVEALADHAHAARLGDGVEGLAFGQGVTIDAERLPPWADGLRTVDRVMVVRRQRDPDTQTLVALHELAHELLTLARVEHTHVDVWRLALALGAPRAMLDRLAREGRLTPLHLAVVSGLPAWAAAWRVGEMAANRSATARSQSG